MKISDKLLKILNFLTLFLFLLPVSRLDLFHENYSTLSLDTRGYFFLLFLGIITGIIMAYETRFISGKRNSIILLMGMIMGTMIPHHYPYDLQGDLHLLFAYVGFTALVVITFMNTYFSKKQVSYQKILFLLGGLSCVLYLRHGMVNTLNEVFIMMACMAINLMIYLERNG